MPEPTLSQRTDPRPAQQSLAAPATMPPKPASPSGQEARVREIVHGTRTVGAAEQRQNRADEYEAFEGLRSRARSRAFDVESAIGSGRVAIRASEDLMRWASTEYKSAFSQFEATLSSARKEAREGRFWSEAVIGVTVGVLISLAAEKALMEWLLLAVIAKASAEAAKEAVMAAVGAAEGAPVQLEPTQEVRTEIAQLGIWYLIDWLRQSLDRLHDIGKAQDEIADESAEYLLDLLEQRRGKMPAFAPQTRQLARQRLERLDRAARGLPPRLASLKMAYGQIAAAARQRKSARPDWEPDSVEKQIWILWIASLDYPYDELDLDPIVHRLTKLNLVGGASPILGVGACASQKDRSRAASQARLLSLALTTDLEQVMARMRALPAP